MHPLATGRFNSRRSTVYGTEGMVATSQPLAAQAGLDVMREGGNAFDAAVATAAALNVVEPTSTGLGGDVFALYRTADGEVGAMRSCGEAPGAATVEATRAVIDDREDLTPWYGGSGRTEPEEVNRHDPTLMPSFGPLTVTVPGTARGWEATVERLGRLTLAEVLAPAIRYAIDGYPVSEVIAAAWRSAETLFRDEHARRAYLFDGNAPSAGQRVRLPALGKTMETIADAGADVVYEGHIAEAIANEVQAHGGLLSVDDLASFSPEFIDPISTTYNGVEVFELPPNNQGMIVLEALNIASTLDIGDLPRDSVERIHGLIEATKLAFVDGHRYIADPAYSDVPPLSDPNYAEERAETIDSRAIDDAPIGYPDSIAEGSDTVLLTVCDREGNLVSYINSRFKGFGSGLVAGETGIALQNRGASFSLDPSDPNRIEPGKRPYHTLIPAVARFDENDWLAFGVMGGYMQPQGHVQVLTNLIDLEMSPQEALDAPRWRYQVDGSVSVEPDFPGSDDLVRRGHDVRLRPPSWFGGGQLIRLRDSVMSGGSDPRKDGTVVTR